MICALFHFPIIITHETHLLPVHCFFSSYQLVHCTIPHPFPDRVSTIILKPNSRKVYIISPVLETMAHDTHFLSFFIFVLHTTVFAPLDSHWPVYTIYHHMWKGENKLFSSRCRQVGQVWVCGLFLAGMQIYFPTKIKISIKTIPGEKTFRSSDPIFHNEFILMIQTIMELRLLEWHFCFTLSFAPGLFSIPEYLTELT